MNIIQIPLPLTPSNNYCWVSIDPTTPYSGLTNYYVRYDLTLSGATTNYFTNNVKVYSTVYQGYAPFDCHRVLNDYVTYDLTVLSGLANYWSSPQSILRYTIYETEMSGSTPLTAKQWVFSGYTFNGVVDRDVIFNYLNYVIGPYVSNRSFLTNWIGPMYTRPTDFGSLSWINIGALEMRLDIVEGNGSQATFYTHVQSPNAILFENFGCGYYEVNNMNWYQGFPSTPFTHILDTFNVQSYTLQLTAGPSGAQGRSVVQQFIVDRDCTLMDNIELIWLNDLGGWDFYTFYREYHYGYKIDKTIYNTNDYAMSNTGLMYEAQPKRGETILTNRLTETYHVKSKILNNIN